MNQDLAKFFEFTPDACCVLDARGVVKHANPAFKRVMADTSTDLIGRRLVDLVHVDDAAATRERLAETSPDTSPTTFASRLPSTTDRDRVLLWSVRAEPSTGLLYASARDITDLERERDSLRQIIDASPGAMVLVDEHGSISMVNLALERIFGYERDELLGQAIEVLVPRADRDTHRSHRQAFTAQPRARPMGERRDLVGVHKDGTEVPIEIGLNPIPTPRGINVLGALVDLTERRLAEQMIAAQAQELAKVNERLSEMASTDSLTRLWNRRAFLDQLGIQMELARRTGRPMSVMILDVDHFKPYNDEFGHLAGDEVLRSVSRILTEVARRSDYVARIGGEEFAFILPETDQRGAEHLGQRFRLAIAEAEWSLRAITASIGATTVTLQRDNGDPPDDWRSQLLSEADKALYHSKEQGRNRFTHVKEILES